MEERVPSAAVQPKQVKKPWGVLAYIAGDNNLSDAGLEDVRELCQVGASPEVHVGVEIDILGEFTGSIRYEISEPDFTGRAHRIVIERLPEQDTGHYKTLVSFLKWGFKRFLADDYLVVVWNHGSGFRTLTRDIAFDDYGTSLDMPAIERAFKLAGLGKGRKITVLGFDACLMAMLEIVYHFKDYVRFIVGSEQTEPGDGWPYDQVLRCIKTAKEPMAVARQIVKEYIKSYKDEGETNVTQSAIDVEKTEAAVQALSVLGDLLGKAVKSHRNIIKKIRLKAQTFEMADYVDLIHLCSLLSTGLADSNVKTAAETTARKAADCILFSDALGKQVQYAHGLSIWFPASEKLYFDYRAKYLALNCNKKYDGWVNFLDAYYTYAEK